MGETKRTVTQPQRARACNPSVLATVGKVLLCPCAREEPRSHKMFYF